MANIRITDKQTVTPTGSDFMLINQAGSDKNTTLARLKTYMNGSTALETEAQDTNSAINEVNTKATNASTDINGIKNTIGSGTLETTSQNLIGATNEINTRVGTEKLETVAENATGAINELNKKIGDIDVENDGDIASQLNAMTQEITNLKTNPTEIEIVGENGFISNSDSKAVYFKSLDGVVTINCYLKNSDGNTGNATLFNLPEGYKPGKMIRVIGYTNADEILPIVIRDTGQVDIVKVPNNLYNSLQFNVSFLASN